MAALVLQTYLRLQLLELGGEDERLKKLATASSNLARTFAESPKSALPIFIATLCGVESFEFSAVATAIENEWSTYHGVFRNGSARTLYEAVSLEAIAEAIKTQPKLGVAISLILRNFGPHVQIGKNKPVFETLTADADASLAAQFERVTEYRAGRPSIVPTFSKATTWDRDALKKRIEAAVGPQNRAGQAIENSNAHWPNAGNPWSYEFSDRLTVILGDYLDGVSKNSHEAFKKYIEALGENYRKACGDDDAMRRSIALLWWRQALFSVSAKKPYRELAPVQIAIHAAIDLATLIPSAYEPAFESFLFETVTTLLPTQPKFASADLLKADTRAIAALETALSSKPTGLLVTSILARAEANSYLPAKLPVQRWAIWLLREIKALEAAQSPLPTVQGD